MKEAVYKIRKEAIEEIKKKTKLNPKYLHPCNKERLEDMKRLMFVSGNEFTHWMQNNGIMVNVSKTTTEYLNRCAKDLGFDDWAEYIKIRSWENGCRSPSEFNENCPKWFGDFTEDLMIHYYPGAIKMPPFNPGFDYIWRLEDKEIRINNKSSCLRYRSDYGNPYFGFGISWNNKADKFILSGWDNRCDLNPMYAWEFDKNEMIRKAQGNVSKTEFWKRDSFIIINTPEGLEQFEDYQIDISWLQELIQKEHIL